jgi:hypothetical protein
MKRPRGRTWRSASFFLPGCVRLPSLKGSFGAPPVLLGLFFGHDEFDPPSTNGDVEHAHDAAGQQEGGDAKEGPFFEVHWWKPTVVARDLDQATEVETRVSDQEEREEIPIKVSHGSPFDSTVGVFVVL